ncbi:hypothetical protein D3C72_1607210 [compost metagenome]
MSSAVSSLMPLAAVGIIFGCSAWHCTQRAFITSCTLAKLTAVAASPPSALATAGRGCGAISTATTASTATPAAGQATLILPLCLRMKNWRISTPASMIRISAAQLYL